MPTVNFGDRAALLRDLTNAPERETNISSLNAALLDILRRGPAWWHRHTSEAGADGIESTHPRLTRMGLRLRTARVSGSSGGLHIGFSPKFGDLNPKQWKEWHDPAIFTLAAGLIVGSPDDFDKFVRRWMHATGRTKETPGDPMDLITYGNLEIFDREGGTDYSALRNEYPSIRVLVQLHPGQNWDLQDPNAEPKEIAAAIDKKLKEWGADGLCLDTHHLVEWVHERFGDTKDAEEKQAHAQAMAFELASRGTVKRIHFGPGRAVREFDGKPYRPTEKSMKEAHQELWDVAHGRINETPQDSILHAVRQGEAAWWIQQGRSRRQPFFSPITMENPPTAALSSQQLEASADLTQEQLAALTPGIWWKLKATFFSSQPAAVTTRAVIENIKKTDKEFKSTLFECALGMGSSPELTTLAKLPQKPEAHRSIA